MKKIILMAGLMLSATFAYPLDNHKTEIDKKEKQFTEAERKEIQAIESRIEEIRTMDFSTLEKGERKALRKELKEMQGRGRKIGHGHGIYLSTGAVIIILLLIIIL